MKKVPYIQIIVVLAVIAAVIYVIKTYVITGSTTTKADTTPKGGSSSTPKTPSSGSTTTAPAVSVSGLPIKGNTYVLKRGDKAAEVKYIQYEYNERFVKPYNVKVGEDLAIDKIAVDGIFGGETEKAVELIMKKKTTSYKEFKDAIDAHQQLSIDAMVEGGIPEWMKLW